MQASGRRLEPGAEVVLGPVFRSQQNDPGAANIQRAQVGVAALGDAPEDKPVDICRDTRPSQAAKSRPLPKAAPSPTAETMALAMIGPIPGMSEQVSHV